MPKHFPKQHYLFRFIGYDLSLLQHPFLLAQRYIKYNLKLLLEMFIFCLSLLDIRWFYDISGFYCPAK